MSEALMIAIVAALGGSLGTAIISAIANRRKAIAEAAKIESDADTNRIKSAAEAAKLKADATKIITDATKEILGEYRLRNDELENEIADLKCAFREFQAEAKKRDKQFRQEQALQDREIENTNAMVLKLQLVNEILMRQIRSLGIEPLISLSEIGAMTIQELRDISRSLADNWPPRGQADDNE